MRLAFIPLLLAAVPCAAQVQPRIGDSNAHLQTVDYDADQVVRLRGSPGYELMVALSPDEQIQSVAIGDSGSWQVSVNKAADRLFLKPVQASPGTNMTVVTSVRVYNFDLLAMDSPAPDMPYTVEFHYPPPKMTAMDGQYVDVSAAARRRSHYKISGARELRPASISDDGQHTYIAWPKGSPIPAVYAVDHSGKELLVNGMMGTNDVYVVDGAPQLLTFRIDRQMAVAERLNPRKGR